jgi:hypothetical protein
VAPLASNFGRENWGAKNLWGAAKRFKHQRYRHTWKNYLLWKFWKTSMLVNHALVLTGFRRFFRNMSSSHWLLFFPNNAWCPWGSPGDFFGFVPVSPLQNMPCTFVFYRNHWKTLPLRCLFGDIDLICMWHLRQSVKIIALKLRFGLNVPVLDSLLIKFPPK